MDKTMDQIFEEARLDGAEMRLDSPPAKVEFFCDGKLVLTLTKDGITANPDVPVDEAAKAVFKVLEPYIRDLKR